MESAEPRPPIGPADVALRLDDARHNLNAAMLAAEKEDSPLATTWLRQAETEAERALALAQEFDLMGDA